MKVYFSILTDSIKKHQCHHKSFFYLVSVQIIYLFLFDYNHVTMRLVQKMHGHACIFIGLAMDRRTRQVQMQRK
jgi:hypothetical protein